MAEPVYTLYVPRRIHDLAEALEALSESAGGTPSAVAMAEARADWGHDGASCAEWDTVWRYLMDQQTNDDGQTHYVVADIPASAGLQGCWSDQKD